MQKENWNSFSFENHMFNNINTADIKPNKKI